MALALLACTMLASSFVTEAPSKSLSIESTPSQVPFAIYRPSTVHVDYRLVVSRMFDYEGTPVLRLTYINREKRHQFDLVQFEAKSGRSAKALVESKKLGLEMTEDTVFLTDKKGSTAIGFVGSMLSVPSAKQLVADLSLWRKS
jgi:hypothetical protein